MHLKLPDFSTARVLVVGDGGVEPPHSSTNKQELSLTGLGWLYLLIPTIVIIISFQIIGIGWDGLRLGILYLPGIWLTWQAMTKIWRGWTFLTHLWAFIFSLDTTIRLFLWIQYQSNPDSNYILQALANTTPNESLEYITQYYIFAPFLLLTAFFITLWIFLAIKLPFKYINTRTPKKITRKILIGTLAFLIFAAYVGRPTRDKHPVVFWSNYINKIHLFNAKMHNTQNAIHTWDKNANDYLTYEGPTQQTFVLVIGESLTKFNTQICGYPRTTTPKLHSIRDELLIFCNAYSPAASTMQSLQMMLTDAELDKGQWNEGSSLFSRARKAGFQIHWISNHDDLFTSSLMGRYADKSIFVNRRSGRTNVSLDSAIIPHYQQALANPSPRKLIILHLLGSHPNYSTRYPNEYDIYNSSTPDLVTEKLDKQNRGLWIKTQRAHYDNSVLYHDTILFRTINYLKNSNGSVSEKKWLFLPDHGNEVGHTRNAIGHSPNTEAGYSIPLLLWYNENASITDIEQRQIVTDTLDQTIMNLMGIQWKSYDSSKDWLSVDYKWQPPRLWPLWNQYTNKNK